jgi:hypothetical protein
MTSRSEHVMTALLAAITRELVRTEIQVTKQNPEMAEGIALARWIIEQHYSEKLADK